MKKKEIYVAFDGTEFDTEKECQNYEEENNKNTINENRLVYLESGKSLTKDEVKEFFKKISCSECPFSKECRAMEQRIRRSTTDTFCLCNTILGNINSFGLI